MRESHGVGGPSKTCLPQHAEKTAGAGYLSIFPEPLLQHPAQEEEPVGRSGCFFSGSPRRTRVSLKASCLDICFGHKQLGRNKFLGKWVSKESNSGPST